MRIKLHALTEEQRDLLKDISSTLKHNWHKNLARILKNDTYTNQDKKLILDPLRKRYIRHLRKTKS